VTNDRAHNGLEAEYWAEDGVAGPLLCGGVFLDPILLIFESDGDKVGMMEEVGIFMFHNRFGAGSKYESPEHDAFGLSQ
jgi:hypothetical protein